MLGIIAPTRISARVMPSIFVYSDFCGYCTPPSLTPSQKKTAQKTHHLLPDLFICPPQPHHDRQRYPQITIRQQDALSDHVALRQAAEDVDEDGAYTVVVQDGTEGSLDRVAGRFAARVEEVGDVAPARGQAVDGVHGEAGAVD